MLVPFDTPTLVKAQLDARLEETVALVPWSRRTGIVSLTLELSQLPGFVPVLADPHFSFSHAEREDLRAGYGSTVEWQGFGPDRLADLRARALALKREWLQLDPDDTGMEPFALAGFAAASGSTDADGLPEALLWLPEVAVRRRRGQAVLVFSTCLPADRDVCLRRWRSWLDRLVPGLCRSAPGPLNPGPLRSLEDRPDRAGWIEAVEAALAAIAEGTLEKVVLARRQRVQGRRTFDLERLGAALTYLFPSCQVIRLQREGQCLVAATPERLLAQRGTWAEVDAIAGTAGRAAGSARDLALGEALRSSPKELREHALVTDALRAALTPVSHRVEAQDGPSLLRLNNAQHLWTHIRAELQPGMDALALADLLHPTPATNGAPCAAAQAWLAQAEPWGRGWYTGAAGWLERDLSGEFWVLLRCAEIQGDHALLHAGAGIVAGSDPAGEWGETEAKLAAMLTALQFA